MNAKMYKLKKPETNFKEKKTDCDLFHWWFHSDLTIDNWDEYAYEIRKNGAKFSKKKI